MRVLFALSGTIWVHTLPEGFRDAGHEVLVSGPIEESSIRKSIQEFKPHFMVSMGWGLDQTRERQLILRKVSREFNVPHVYWSLEDPAYTFNFSIPLFQRMQPDFILTICQESAGYFKRLGFRADHMDFGYAPKIHHPIDAQGEYKARVAVVANAYPDILGKYPEHYRHQSIKTLITPLLRENIPIDFWGRNWREVSRYTGYDIPLSWIHGYLNYAEANKVYCSSDIVIGLQNYTGQVTQRTYEVLASGGFLLTSDTPGVRKLFKPSRDLAVSASPEETVKLVKYYLEHPLERKQIALGGREAVRCHSYSERASLMMGILKREGIIAP